MRRLFITIGVLASTVLPAGVARAASESASCAGIGLSDHARAHEMRAVVHDDLFPFAEALGTNIGGLLSFFAKFHEGTHEACEAVVS